jgi:hypothetical protein
MDTSLNMPAGARPSAARAPRNWSMIVRVGLVCALILSLVGYALKVTYESVIKGGVVQTGDHYKVELKQMSSFEMDQSNGTLEDIPARFRELDGKKVILEGEVAPGEEGGNKVRLFDLCYSVQQCCFSGPPKAQHFVRCKPVGNRLVPNYLNQGQIRVSGTLHVKVVKEEGAIQRVFHLDLEQVEPMS